MHLVAMHFDRVISRLIRDKTSGFTLSDDDISSVCGWYILTDEEIKYYFQYAYNAIKIAHVEFFPTNFPIVVSFHDICAAFISLHWTECYIIIVGDTV